MKILTGHPVLCGIALVELEIFQTMFPLGLCGKYKAELYSRGPRSGWISDYLGDRPTLHIT